MKEITTAVWYKDHYRHFGIHPKTAMLYGDNPSEIVNVELSVAEDQSEVSAEEHTKKEPDYWGWFDENQKRFTMIYPKYFLLNMCFPAGVKPAEEAGQGKAYRLNVKEINGQTLEKG
jgi:hypothetical protein